MGRVLKIIKLGLDAINLQYCGSVFISGFHIISEAAGLFDF